MYRRRDMSTDDETTVSRMYSNVFEAVCDDPVEAADLMMRSDLMIDIREKLQGVPTYKAIALLDVSRKRWKSLLKGHISEFSREQLERMHAALG
jgi:predicted XRE-type DNA-binding protein